mmetsp:Transcript_17331/g.21862  ORF Transcript_17331/g.21862 Transcript_17331/m.21862 type:complete len:113 (-) Transcript_17331:149-487(-)
MVLNLAFQHLLFLVESGAFLKFEDDSDSLLAEGLRANLIVRLIELQAGELLAQANALILLESFRGVFNAENLALSLIDLRLSVLSLRQLRVLIKQTLQETFKLSDLSLRLFF